MGRQPLIIVADAELCREVGIKKFKDIPNRSIPSPIAASPLHQKGLFFTRFGSDSSIDPLHFFLSVNDTIVNRDSRWSTMRNTVLSVYQPSHLASLVPTMQSYIESASETLDFLSASDDVVFSKLSLGLASDVIGQAAFGVNFHMSGHAPPRGEISGESAVTEFIDKHTYSTTQLKMDLTGSLSIIIGLVFPILQEPFRQILKRIPGTMDWKVDRTNQALSGQLDEIVANRAAEKDRGSKDFLSCVLNARDSGSVSGEIFSPDYVSAATYEHLIAGSATTAFTMSAVVYLVAGHPAVETKLVAEIDAFGDRKPTAEDLQSKFPYLDQASYGSVGLLRVFIYLIIYIYIYLILREDSQVVKEAMRFYLVSPLIARETSKKVEIGGYTLPKVLIDLLVLLGSNNYCSSILQNWLTGFNAHNIFKSNFLKIDSMIELNFLDFQN